MLVFNKNCSALIEGKTIYKTGNVLVNLEDNTYLTFVVNRDNILLSPYLDYEDIPNFGYIFQKDLTKAIRFKDDLEEWLIYRYFPLKVVDSNIYKPLYHKQKNPDGFWSFRPIRSI